MKIGIDLDNTLINYDNAFLAAAKISGLIAADFTSGKQQLRDHIRTLPNGETEWQKLQGYVYGKGISEATLFDGAMDFVTRAQAAGHTLFIVSHKTIHGHFDEDKVNLREAALAFLATKNFPIPRDHIHFETTRAEKVSKLASLALNWFIDDLVEVYEEAHFPEDCKKILFSSAAEHEGNWINCKSWNAIEGVILS